MIVTHFFFGRRHTGAATLRLLIAQAQAGNLHVCQSDEWVVLAFGNLDGSSQRAFYDRAVDVVAKFSG